MSLTRRTFPHVIVSLMLATPAFTTQAAADPGREHNIRSAPARPAAPRKRVVRHQPAPHAVQQAAAAPHHEGWSQSGLASWYGGKRWQGKMTASGVRYDERALTAAHSSLPIGSKVKVVVADTGRSVTVTINDRPGTRKRVIDLSRGAAEALGILNRGVAEVTLVRG